MTPLARIVRTVVQVVVACAAVVPLVVALLGEVGITVDGARLVTVAAAAVALVTTAQNALERVGLIPTLGAPTVGGDHAEEIALAVSEIGDPDVARRVAAALTRTTRGA